jgi:hypothetical protein
MKKTLLLLIIIFVFNFGCGNQKYTPKSESELSIKEKDSVLKIIGKLYGNWISINDEFIKLNKKGFYLSPMRIEKFNPFVELNNSKKTIFLNKIRILESIPIAKTNDKISDSIINANFLSVKYFHLTDSNLITITKMKKHYGFLYTNKKKYNFIPIKTLNDTLLILKDGRKFKRTKKYRSTQSIVNYFNKII